MFFFAFVSVQKKYEWKEIWKLNEDKHRKDDIFSL